MDEGGNSSIGFIIFIGFIILQGLCYSFGTGIQMINRKDLEKEQNPKRKKSVSRLLRMKDEPNSFIGTVQVITALTSMVVGQLQVPIFTKLLGNFIVGFTAIEESYQPIIFLLTRILVMVILILLIVDFGVIIPKKIASNRSSGWVFKISGFIYIVTIIFRPFTYMIQKVANGFLKILGISMKESLEDVTEEEIISIVNEGHEQGILLENEAKMIHNIMEFSDKEAQHIMTHRKNIIGLECHKSLEETLDFVLNSIYSRFPVYDETIDDVIGIVYLKDLMKASTKKDNIQKNIQEIEGLIRTAIYIPETRKIDLLFQTMRTEKVQMIVVIDEYGQTSGLISMEDILEEIVGNIFDEYDEDENFILCISEDKYLAAGFTPLEEIEELLSIDFDGDDYTTLNGYLIAHLNRIPETSEELEIETSGWIFRILSVKENVIEKVEIEKGKEETEITVLEVDSIENEG